MNAFLKLKKKLAHTTAHLKIHGKRSKGFVSFLLKISRQKHRNYRILKYAVTLSRQHPNIHPSAPTLTLL